MFNPANRPITNNLLKPLVSVFRLDRIEAIAEDDVITLFVGCSAYEPMIIKSYESGDGNEALVVRNLLRQLLTESHNDLNR